MIGLGSQKCRGTGFVKTDSAASAGGTLVFVDPWWRALQNAANTLRGGAGMRICVPFRRSPKHPKIVRRPTCGAHDLKADRRKKVRVARFTAVTAPLRPSPTTATISIVKAKSRTTASSSGRTPLPFDMHGSVRTRRTISVFECLPLADAAGVRFGNLFIFQDFHHQIFVLRQLSKSMHVSWLVGKSAGISTSSQLAPKSSPCQISAFIFTKSTTPR